MAWHHRLRNLFRGDALDRELREEIDSHAAAAGARFGNRTRMQEQMREADTFAWLESVLADVRYAGRTLARSPLFAILATTSLALGIGANTAIFTLADAVLFRSLPVPRPEELLIVDKSDAGFSYPLFRSMAEVLPAEASLAAMTRGASGNTNVNGARATLQYQIVSGSFFGTLGVKAHGGRLLTPDDDRSAGAHAVAVVSHGYWVRRFASDGAAVGRVIEINDVPLRIVGIAERGFTGTVPGDVIDAWIPAAMQKEVRYASNTATYGSFDDHRPFLIRNTAEWLTLMLRAPQGIREQAMARVKVPFELDRKEMASMIRGDPSWTNKFLEQSLRFTPGGRGSDYFRSRYATPVAALTVLASLVLLLASVNLANILLARGEARRREVAVRLAIGAGRARVVRVMVIESAMLACAGAVVGLTLAGPLRSVLGKLGMSTVFLAAVDPGLNPRMLFIALALAFGTAILFGSAPALAAARVSLAGALQAGTRSSESARQGLFGRSLVVTQMAVCVVLVVTAGLLSRSLWKLLHADVGMPLEHRITVRLDRDAVTKSPDMALLTARILESVRTVPGVDSAAISIAELLGGGGSYSNIYASGHNPGPQDRGSIQENMVTAGYFRTVGLALRYGRECEERDRAGSPPVVMVSEAFARHYFGTTDAIGRRIGYSRSRDREFEIVGVVRDAQINGPRDPAPEWVAHCMAQHKGHFVIPQVLEVAFRGDPQTVVAGLRQALARADTNVPVRSVMTMRQLHESKLSQERMMASVSGFFGVLAAVLAAVGVYGLLAYGVVRRRNEIGIRMALGAHSRDVVWQVLAGAWGLSAVGIAVGIPVALIAARGLERFLFGLEPYDAVTYSAAVAGLFGVATAAALVPGLRASRIDPVVALRAD